MFFTLKKFIGFVLAQFCFVIASFTVVAAENVISSNKIITYDEFQRLLNQNLVNSANTETHSLEKEIEKLEKMTKRSQEEQKNLTKQINTLNNKIDLINENYDSLLRQNSFLEKKEVKEHIDNKGIDSIHSKSVIQKDNGSIKPFFRLGLMFSVNQEVGKWFDETNSPDKWTSVSSSSWEGYSGYDVSAGLEYKNLFIAFGREKRGQSLLRFNNVVRADGGMEDYIEGDLETTIFYWEVGAKRGITKNSWLEAFYSFGDTTWDLEEIRLLDNIGFDRIRTDFERTSEFNRIGLGYGYEVSSNLTIHGRLQYTDYGDVNISTDGGRTGANLSATEAKVGLIYAPF